ncbi:hypothetical protein F4780DRAFT_782180 [Xylariomycetidae sp. FL0641]|nr:hypothetical protein F4780DRAFT_782180 [Xylariomycetidae sp. FL0641]
MSGQRVVADMADYNVEEMEQWHLVRHAREQEDQKLQMDYARNQDYARMQLVGLYDRKSQLEAEVVTVENNIRFYENEQERFAHDHEAAQKQRRDARAVEDRDMKAAFLSRRARDYQSPGLPGPSPSPSQANKAAQEDAPSSGGGGFTSINGSSRRRTRRDENNEPSPPDAGNILSSVYQNPVDDEDAPTSRAMPLRSVSSRSRHPPDPEADAFNGNWSKERPLKPKQERHSLPSFSSIARSPAATPDAAPEPVPKVRSGRKSLPTAKASVSSGDSPVPESTESDVEEITRANLLLRDDGHVLTAPEMYAGTPLERIHPQHPYWSPDWEPLEDSIQPQLDKWRERLEGLRRDPNAVRHTVFLANRQCNRGQAVIDFLRDGDFHPYQFVGKEMMNKFYKTFINYDTMFRLVNILEELKKFELDITPLEWLRQRIYNLAQAQGDKFNLSKLVHNLYHDALLKQLRTKHGFGNIGRPSGYKVGEKDPTRSGRVRKSKKETEAGSKTPRTRKMRRSIGQVDAEDARSSMGDMDLQAQQALPSEYLEPVTPRLSKRQRLEPTPPPEQTEDELDYDGYSTRDSFSSGRIMHLDWRVSQIKTRSLTTSTQVTQYWTWKGDNNKFEHQVLRETHPKVTWGFYQKPINFDLELSDVLEIQYSPDSEKILALTKDQQRGDVLACFKRERTKRRFLAFAKKKGIKLAKKSCAEVDQAWNEMISETMPDEESEENNS